MDEFIRILTNQRHSWEQALLCNGERHIAGDYRQCYREPEDIQVHRQDEQVARTQHPEIIPPETFTITDIFL